MRNKWGLVFLVFICVAAYFIIPKIYATVTEKSIGSVPFEITPSENMAYATFAGGCFWCMEPPFEKLPGVYEVISGYTGGQLENPSYNDVTTGTTGHVEAVIITYNPNVIEYSTLLDVYWRQVDPTDDKGQFVDRGTPYLSVIYYHNEEQQQAAIASKKALEDSGRFNQPLVTEIKEVETFYIAEDYHQDYYLKNTFRYDYYRNNSGRDAFLDKVWGEDRHITPEVNTNNNSLLHLSKEELRSVLTNEQYYVTQEDGTEEPYNNEYWDLEEEGIYVDIISGEALFSSKDKYDSGTGWPSFTKPLVEDNIVELEDRGFFTVQTEIRSKLGNAHLGHVFDDGPEPTGLRYCMNSAALRFVPKGELEKEGYAEFVELFDEE
ncbi:peptide-methionine (R)-S-oxide reductase MsrB [Sutcliffiella deserti]|uniref:peptide-methionine (R)-S-oxide reductase MsrB n=1 Tax=Sutcliffiella deserti TaxID=2875501 RepID=UPI001CBB2983|nr:peptide-methionine (R)-S-oxide reductase MsrB [Sutcliffiella deserti]